MTPYFHILIQLLIEIFNSDNNLTDGTIRRGIILKGNTANYNIRYNFMILATEVFFYSDNRPFLIVHFMLFLIVDQNKGFSNLL